VVLIDPIMKAPTRQGHASGDRRPDAKGRAREAERDAILSRITATADYMCSGIAISSSKRCSRTARSRRTYAKAQPLLKSDAIFAPTLLRCDHSLRREFRDQSKFIGNPFLLAGEKDDAGESSSVRTPAMSASPRRSTMCA